MGSLHALKPSAERERRRQVAEHLAQLERQEAAARDKFIQGVVNAVAITALVGLIFWVML